MLTGTLDDFTLPDVFRLMSFAKKTGRVDVVRSAGQGKVYFRDGEVYFAESSLSKEPLGQKLVRSRAVTEGQLMKALDEHASSGERLGSVLLRNGVVTSEQLESAVRQQIEDAIFDLLRWELGEFAWEPGGAIDTEVQIGVSVENLIMEASRRLDEYEVIKRKIPSGSAVLGMAATPPEGAVEINITPQEWRILVLVDGQRTVEDIAALVGLDEFGAMRVLYGLVSAGLIELISEGRVAEPAAEVLVEEPAATMTELAQGTVSEPELDPVAEPEQAVEVFEPEVLSEPEEIASAEEIAEPEPFVEAVAAATEESPAETLAETLAELESQTGDPADPGLAEQAETPDAFIDAEPEAMDLASFGIGPMEETPEPAAAANDDAAWSEVVDIEQFDAPTPEELTTSTPDLDPFMSGMFAEPAVAPSEEPPAPPAAPEPEEIPVSSAPSGDEPSVDRAAVVRELAGLFSDEERPRARPSAPAPQDGATPDERKRVEDDDQVTKGIISRLIDGVKGL